VGDTKVSGRRVTSKAPSARVEEGQAAPRRRPQPFSRILTAWNMFSANFAKNNALRSTKFSADSSPIASVVALYNFRWD
jgi:hypothetical protein